MYPSIYALQRHHDATYGAHDQYGITDQPVTDSSFGPWSAYFVSFAYYFLPTIHCQHNRTSYRSVNLACVAYCFHYRGLISLYWSAILGGCAVLRPNYTPHCLTTFKYSCHWLFYSTCCIGPHLTSPNRRPTNRHINRSIELFRASPHSVKRLRMHTRMHPQSGGWWMVDGQPPWTCANMYAMQLTTMTRMSLMFWCHVIIVSPYIFNS